MTQFEFLMIVGGVVISIGVAEILSGWGQLIRRVGKIYIDVLYLGWSTFAIFMVLIYYVGMWPYRDHEFLYFGQIFFLVIPSMFFTLLAYALTPNFESVHFSEYFEQKRKAIYVCMVLFILTAAAADSIIAQAFDLHAVLFTVAFAGIFGGMAFVRKRWLHVAIIYVFLAGTVETAFSPIEDAFERFE